MRAWVIAIGLLFGAAAYFIAFPDTKFAGRQDPQVSTGNLFFSPKPIAAPYEADPIEFGEKLVAAEKYADAVSVFGNVFSSGAAEKKAAAILNGGVALALMNDPSSRRHARELFDQYLGQFPNDLHRDAAHYYLGAIASDEQEPSTALAHFTTIVADFPNSGFFRNAVFHSKNLAALLERQDNTFKERVLRVVGPLIPRNPAGLTTLLGYFVAILGWLVYDWTKVKDKLFKERQPAAWAVLALSITLVIVNYAREWRHTATILDAPKILQPLKR